MKRKTFNLLSVIVTAISTVAVGVVTYIGKGPMTAINDSIVIVEGAIIAVCANFVKDE
jgi:hypothetical protein